MSEHDLKQRDTKIALWLNAEDSALLQALQDKSGDSASRILRIALRHLHAAGGYAVVVGGAKK